MVSVKVFKALRELASDEKHRIVMRSFRLESTGEIVATDGKIMGIVKREENGSPLKSATLDRDAIDRALKIAPKDGMIDPDSGSAFGLPLDEIPEAYGRYPEWARAVPADADSDERAHLSLGIPALESLLKACKALGAGYVTLKLPAAKTTKKQFNSILDGIAFSANPGGLDGVIMPYATMRERSEG